MVGLTNFQSFRINAEKRICNMVAHRHMLASYAREKGDCLLLGTVPNSIHHDLQNDCNTLDWVVLFPTLVILKKKLKKKI